MTTKTVYRDCAPPWYAKQSEWIGQQTLSYLTCHALSGSIKCSRRLHNFVEPDCLLGFYSCFNCITAAYAYSASINANPVHDGIVPHPVYKTPTYVMVLASNL